MVANDDIASHSGASRRKASRSFSFLGCNAYSARIRNEICAKMFLSSFLSPTNITRLRIKNFLVFHNILSEYYEMPSSAAYLSLFSLRNSNAFCGPLLRYEELVTSEARYTTVFLSGRLSEKHILFDCLSWINVFCLRACSIVLNRRNSCFIVSQRRTRRLF